jgi:hypothetical protein
MVVSYSTRRVSEGQFRGSNRAGVLEGVPALFYAENMGRTAHAKHRSPRLSYYYPSSGWGRASISLPKALEARPFSNC